MLETQQEFHFEKDKKMPPKFKRKSSSITNGSVKKKSKLKLFIPIPEDDTVDKKSGSDTEDGSSESDNKGKNLESDDKEAQSSNSETKEKQLENDTTTDESSKSDADGENLESDDEDQSAESDTDGENLGSDDEDQSSESDPEDNNNCGKCVAKMKKFQRLKLLNEEAKFKLECLEESRYSMMSNEWNGGEDDEEGSENYVERLCYGNVEWFGLRSKIHDLEIANDKTKTKLETEAASAKKAQEKSKAEATVELQKVKHQLQTEVASKESLVGSNTKFRKLRQDWAIKVYQSNPDNEDLDNLLSLEPEKLFKKYEQLMKETTSDRIKLEEITETLQDVQNKLKLQTEQRGIYEKQLSEIRAVLHIPAENCNFANILPVVKDLLEQNETNHCSNGLSIVESTAS